MLAVVICALAIVIMVLAHVIVVHNLKDRDKSSGIMMSVYHDSVIEMKDKIDTMGVMLDKAHYVCDRCGKHIKEGDMVFWSGENPHCPRCASEINTSRKED